MKYITHAVILGVVLLTAITLDSCREESDMVLSYAYDCRNTSNFDDANSSFEGQFKAIWTAMNCNYPIWDYEMIDWDKVYENYLPQFQALDKKDSVSDQELEALYFDILSPLHDGHFMAIIKNLHTGSFLRGISPSYSRLEKREGFDWFWNNNKPKLIDPYEPNENPLNISEYETSNSCQYACFADGIVYLYLKTFDFSFREERNNNIWNIWNRWFNKIQNLHGNGTLKGIIIDLRGNPGGAGQNYQYVIGALQASEVLLERGGVQNGCQIGKIRVKSGIGRKDFLPMAPYYHPIYSENHAVIDNEPIVVLANSYTGSVAEHACLGAKQMSNGRVIGTRTWGAFSPLYNKVDEEGKYYSYNYSGIVGNEKKAPFYICIPCAAFFTNEGELLESVGITPDIDIPFDYNLYKKTRRDNQLERALEYIRTGK